MRARAALVPVLVAIATLAVAETLSAPGGADVVENLWPQSVYGVWNFHVKDLMEASACRQICHGRMTPADAQALFVPDWRAGFCVVFPANARCSR